MSTRVHIDDEAIEALRDQGLSHVKIAKRLGVSPATVCRRLNGTHRAEALARERVPDVPTETHRRPVGRKAWCPKCRLVDMVDDRWRCLWCTEVTLKRRARPVLTTARYVTVKLLREAHQLHAEGASLGDAALAIFDRTAYSRERDLRLLLPKAWAALGLPYRSVADAQRARYEKAPHPLQRLDVTAQDVAAMHARVRSIRVVAAHYGVSTRTINNRLRQARA